MRELTSIEKETIVDALMERKQRLETILSDLKKFHDVNTNSFWYEIECHNNLVKLMKER